MKKTNFTIIVFLLSLISFGQDNNSASDKSFFVGLTFSPDYCYRSLSYTQSDEFLAEYRNEIEIPKFGYTAGVNAIFEFNQSLALEFGALFSDKGQQTKTIETDQEDPDNTIPDAAHNTWHYYYIDIPVKLDYTFKKGELKLFISTGLSTNFFLKQKRVKTEFNPDNQYTYYTYEGFDNINIQALLSAGVDYSISKKLKLRFEPIFRYSLIPISNQEIKRYLYSFGANFGIYYELK